MKKFLIPTLIFIALIIAILGIYFTYQISVRPDLASPQEFVVKPGQTLKQVSQNLYDAGLIKSRLAFEAYLYLKKMEGSIQAGTYELASSSIVELSEIFSAGKVDNEIEIKIIEGWNLNEIATSLVTAQIIQNSSSFLNLAQVPNFASNYDFLQNLNSNSLEGFIFPDTYRVYKDASLKDIITKTLDNFDKKLTPALRTEITAKSWTLYQVLTMASIIEMEVPQETDRPVVAGILWKRLEEDMPLQVDSTLKYIIGKNNCNALTFEELEIDSPYNTYKYRGLPPTPISNPGESALRATIYPKNSDYWFYLSDSEGNTIFSKTLDEHNANIEKYLK